MRFLKPVFIFGSLLAILSYVTTIVFWHGGWPAGAVVVNLRDAKEQPVKGAVLRVYKERTMTLARSPLAPMSGEELHSDDKGSITMRIKGGAPFGGKGWELFWLIPMGDKAPQFDCVITAEGYKPLKFSIWQLFESPDKSHQDLPKAVFMMDGKTVELRIYTHSFVLEQ